MQTLRIFFTKTGEAAYISHLDLQRVMARALRKSGLPVWWSQGFNPHIYMSFALPLPLGQQSLCESVDVKTEAEETDFSRYVQPLNDALPQSIRVAKIDIPKHNSRDILAARYRISYTDAAALAKAVEQYNQLAKAPVLRKTKRSQEEYDLKRCVPVLRLPPDGFAAFEVMLPVGEQGNINPALLTGFLQQHYHLPAAEANITRIEAYVGEDEGFW